MGKASKKRRQFTIRKKAQQREKIRRLEQKYAAARSKGDKEDILGRIRRIAPSYSAERITQAAK